MRAGSSTETRSHRSQVSCRLVKYHRSLAVAAVLLYGLRAQGVASAATYYLNTTSGSDDNPGTSSAPALPGRTRQECNPLDLPRAAGYICHATAERPPAQEQEGKTGVLATETEWTLSEPARRGIVVSLFQKFSLISRERKLALFHRLMQPTPAMRILDLGAQIDPDGAYGGQFIDRYPWKEAVSALNIMSEHVQRIRERYPDIDAQVGDARALPWPDKFFDIVWCNAVIEHVGGREDQRQMAREILRVGKRWFVTTPNRWYPFEFHLRLPLVTWLPWHGYRRCARILCYNHIRGKYMWGLEPEPLRLLSASEMARFFPGSRIIKQRVTFMAETLIAVGGDHIPGLP
jgi:SAM-dependent methyltransferase